MRDFELLLPIGRKADIVRRGVPASLRGKVHAVDGIDAAHEIGRTFGRNTRPQKPIFLWGPDEKSIIIIAGMGKATAAEMEDAAVTQLAIAQEKHAKGKSGFDFAQAREDAGLPQASQFDGLLRQALQDKVAYHKRHQRTDPGHEKQEKRIYQGGIT